MKGVELYRSLCGTDEGLIRSAQCAQDLCEIWLTKTELSPLSHCCHTLIRPRPTTFHFRQSEQFDWR
jgi:hypothetical protein